MSDYNEQQTQPVSEPQSEKPNLDSNQSNRFLSPGYILGLPQFAHISTDPLSDQELPAIVAIGGGKGGVGKSLVSANLGARLAMAGKKVLVLDLDVGGANLHTYFGLGTPRKHIGNLLNDESTGLHSLVTATPVDNLHIIAGGKEEVWGGAQALEANKLKRLFDSLLSAKAELGVDVVLLDLGAGTSRHTLDFFCLAHLGLVTVLPEPTSIENAYLFLKTTLFSIIDHVGERTGMTAAADELKNSLVGNDGNNTVGRVSGYAERMRHLLPLYPSFLSQVFQALQARQISFTVNQTRSQQDIDIGKSMEMIGARYFGFNTRSLGYLNYDEAAWKSLRNRRLLLIDFPHSNLARRFTDMARNVVQTLQL